MHKCIVHYNIINKDWFLILSYSIDDLQAVIYTNLGLPLCRGMKNIFWNESSAALSVTANISMLLILGYICNRVFTLFVRESTSWNNETYLFDLIDLGSWSDVLCRGCWFFEALKGR